MTIKGEWAHMRRLLHDYVKAGGTLRSLARNTGVAQPTLSGWLREPEPPETIAKADAVMSALVVEVDHADT